MLEFVKSTAQEIEKDYIETSVSEESLDIIDTFIPIYLTISLELDENMEAESSDILTLFNHFMQPHIGNRSFWKDTKTKTGIKRYGYFTTSLNYVRQSATALGIPESVILTYKTERIPCLHKKMFVFDVKGTSDMFMVLNIGMSSSYTYPYSLSKTRVVVPETLDEEQVMIWKKNIKKIVKIVEKVDKEDEDVGYDLCARSSEVSCFLKFYADEFNALFDNQFLDSYSAAKDIKKSLQDSYMEVLSKKDVIN